MTDAEKYFTELTEQIPDVKAGKMFGTLCMKMPNGKSAAMFWKDAIVVKLKEEDLKEVLRLKGTKLFEPMKGRLMKEWVQIPFEYKSQWKKFAERSAQHAALVEKKAPKKKK